MPKKFSVLLIVFFICNCFLLYDIQPVKAVTINTSAESAILMEASTGKILFSKEANKELPPASVTKLMTLLIATEAVENGRVKLTDIVTASENASSLGGSQIYLEPGEKLSLEEMLISIAAGSANDACVAVAELISGTHEEFVDEMNLKAKELELKNTHFVNSYGLPAEGHYTSAYDLAIIGKEALKHPLITKLTSIQEYDLRGGDFKLWNTNKLLWWYEGTDGFKTGWTQEAKYCLASTVERDGLRLICVVMGVPEVRGHFVESMKMLNYGFAKYSYKEFSPAGSKQGEVPVQKGMDLKVETVAEKPIAICMEKGKEKQYWIEINLDGNVKAPVIKGQKLGEAIVYSNKEEQTRINLVSNKEVPKAGFLEIIFRTMQDTYSISPTNI
ncbi:MAG: D-alanyl-D-alanine carboxypeptidase family protein [Eubacteriales bacterium]